MQITTEWRTVADAPNYEVSSVGEVRRVTSGRHLKAGQLVSQVLIDGYPCVCLFVDGGRKMHKIHRLVATAFLPPPATGQGMVAHNDGSTTNNEIGNLRWATCIENLSDRAAHGTELLGRRNGRAKLTTEDIGYIRANYKPRHPVYGANRLAEKFGVTDVAVIKAFRGENWAHIA